ncbi:MAG: acyl-CoA desaturase [Symploca sp. SIO1C2]|nr:acyl-CoA desaturase [Symploca sp. SIO1C2]
MTTVKYKETIAADSKLKAWRQFHVLFITLIPLFGFVLTLILMMGGNSIKPLDLGLFLGMWFVSGIGITVGFHRHFTHHGFKTSTPVRVILTIMGCMAAQGPLIYWVSLHRRHHENSDCEGDPHSPHLEKQSNWKQLRGLWQAHIGWMFNHDFPNPIRYAPDLVRDKTISWVNRYYFIWLLMGLAIPTCIGGVLRGSWDGAFNGFLWGGLVRLFLTENFIWSINSITHVYGCRLFNTNEQSTNNIWLAIPTLGEAWHNNHHAFPHSAKFGLKWWQVDLGYWVIFTLKAVGLAWDIKVPTAGMIEFKKSA